MTCTLLCIDSSPRAGDRSHSRWLTARFEEVWRTHNPMVRVVQPIIGSDVSGIIEAVGDAVTDFRVGDEVYCTPQIFKVTEATPSITLRMNLSSLTNRKTYPTLRWQASPWRAELLGRRWSHAASCKWVNLFSFTLERAVSAQSQFNWRIWHPDALRQQYRSINVIASSRRLTRKLLCRMRSRRKSKGLVNILCGRWTADLWEAGDDVPHHSTIWPVVDLWHPRTTI
jgi:hypothetical protein